jgi:hypothetical protein
VPGCWTCSMRPAAEIREELMNHPDIEPMQDRPHSQLTAFTQDYELIRKSYVQLRASHTGTPFNTASDPEYRDTWEAQIAVHVAHHDFIQSVVSRLRLQDSILCICDKLLMHPLYQLIRAEMKEIQVDLVAPMRAANTFSTVIPSRADGPTGTTSPQNAGTSAPAASVRSMFSDLYQKLMPRNGPHVVVITHLDLMTTSLDGKSFENANDIVYWLNEYTDVPVLAFADPGIPLSKIIEDLFIEKKVLPPLRREVLYKLLRPEEAARISRRGVLTISDQASLYQVVSGVNVVQLRKFMRHISAQSEEFPALGDEAGSPDHVYAAIRHWTTIGTLEVPQVHEEDIAGYQETKDELKKRIIFPMRQRTKASNKEALAQADFLAPRGVLLYGPPRTGKTEFAKFLASEMKAPLIAIKGPELKNMYQGETEKAIRRQFAQARKSAPAVILIDEIDSLTPTRSMASSSGDISTVATLLTEMDGLSRDEAVLVIGTTNRLEAVDPAFKAPGRFGVLIEVGYPNADDRRAILELYKSKMGLKELSNLDLLVTETGKSLRKATDREPETLWSCDHLRGICKEILLEREYAKESGLEIDINNEQFLNRILAKVSGNLELASGRPAGPVFVR